MKGSKLVISNFERKVIYFVQKNNQLFFFIIITILAFLMRNNLRYFKSGDYVYSLKPWTDYLEAHGGFLGLKSLESNYNMPYLYILAFITYLPASNLAKIKLVSIIFDFITAFLVMIIVKKINKTAKSSLIPYLAYAFTLFIPTIVLNGTVWGQCDIIYTCFILLSIYFILEKKYVGTLIAYGIALAFKLQAIFVLPVYLFIYFKEKKFSILYFLWIPIVDFILYIPAWIIGKPLAEIFDPYLMQIGQYKSLVLNYSNLYSLLPDNYDFFATAGLFLSVSVLIMFYFLLIKNNTKIDEKNNITIFLITIMLCVYFLPSMHERYMFAADVISVIYLFLYPNRIFVPFIIWFINFNAYLPAIYGFGPIIDFKIMSILYLGLLVFLIWDLMRNMINKPESALIRKKLSYQ